MIADFGLCVPPGGGLGDPARMRDIRVWGTAAVVVAAVVVLAGCSGGGGAGGEGKASAAPSAPAASPSPSPTVAPRDALEAFQRSTYAGCTDTDSCQELMTRELAAAVEVREAMRAKNPDLYAVPIGHVDEAERQADIYGRDNLGAKGNFAAVFQPLQRMTAWFREHPEG